MFAEFWVLSNGVQHQVPMTAKKNKNIKKVTYNISTNFYIQNKNGHFHIFCITQCKFKKS